MILHPSLLMLLLIVASVSLSNGHSVPYPEDRKLRIALAQNPTIVTKMEPTKEYEEHLKKVYANRDGKVVVHQDKLEQKIVHLKEQVRALSKKMSKEEALTAIYRAESRALTKEEEGYKNRHDSSGEGKAELTSSKLSDSPYEEPSVMEERIGRVGTVIIFGFLFLATATFFLLMYGDPKLWLSTWQTIENVASIFIAVMWFQAFDDLLDAGGWQAHHEVLAALLHATFLFSTCVILSWAVREKHQYLTALTAVGAHYISFSALHFGQSTQETFFSWHWALCFLGVIVLFLILLCVGGIHHYIREFTHMHHQEWEDSVDDIENDIGGMVLAFTWTIFVRYVILGRYPEHEPGPGEPLHSPLQRGLMLLYAVLMTVAAFFLVPLLDHWMLEHSQSASRIAIRLHSLCYPFMTMSVAWAYLTWGEWEFYESMFAGNAILARAIFAILVTTTCFAVLLGFSVIMKRRSDAAQARAASAQDARTAQLSKIQAQVDEERERDIRRLVVNMLSLMIAFSWEETFDASVEGAVEGDAHPATAKVLLALLVGAAVLPVYIFYLRPYVDAVDREVHPDGDDDA